MWMHASEEEARVENHESSRLCKARVQGDLSFRGRFAGCRLCGMPGQHRKGCMDERK